MKGALYTSRCDGSLRVNDIFAGVKIRLSHFLKYHCTVRTISIGNGKSAVPPHRSHSARKFGISRPSLHVIATAEPFQQGELS
jgi:hypothetical protein